MVEPLSCAYWRWLPVVAAISYEVLMLLAKRNNACVRALRWPGMQLQRLTTRAAG